MLESTGQAVSAVERETPTNNPASVEPGLQGGLRGGAARAASLSPQETLANSREGGKSQVDEWQILNSCGLTDRADYSQAVKAYTTAETEREARYSPGGKTGTQDADPGRSDLERS